MKNFLFKSFRMSALLQTGLLVDVNIGSFQWEVKYNPKELCYRNQRVNTNPFWAAFLNFYFYFLWIRFALILGYFDQGHREANLPEHSLLWDCSFIHKQPGFATILLFEPQSTALVLVLRSSIEGRNYF